MLLGELLARQPHSGGGTSRLGGKALVQAHCHQKSVLGMEADEEMMKRIGVDYEVLDSGCCGMAGSFGFEKAKYDISMACAERVLLPALRAAAPDTLVIANGFSCREQIAQATGREALHLADLLALASARGAA